MFKRITSATILGLVVCASSVGIAATLHVETSGSNTTLRVENNPPPYDPLFHSTPSTITDATLIEVPGTTMLLVTWKETPPGGSAVAYYAFSFDGHQFARVRRTDYLIRLLAGDFDPVVGTPALPASLQADAAGRLFMVQLVTQPLEPLRQGISNAGGLIRAFLANHALVVEMAAADKTTVEALPYVRSVRPLHPGYRLEDYLRDNWEQRETLFPIQRYNIMVFSPAQTNAVAVRTATIGAVTDPLPIEDCPVGSLLIATLTAGQLEQVVRWDEVAFVDRWTPPSLDMDVARKISGAPVLEAAGGYSGEGVRGEVMDDWVQRDHPAFRGVCVGGSSAGASCSTDGACPGGICDGEPILHGPDPGGGVESQYHGTSSTGCLFGDGTGSPEPAAKGMIPDAQSIVSHYCRLYENRSLAVCSAISDGVTRWCHTKQLVDPAGPFRAVFQSNSWGNGYTITYGLLSSGLDGVVFDNDLLICQSQGNIQPGIVPGHSKPQAWAKNVVSVGGIKHFNSIQRSLHRWRTGFTDYAYGAIGPASDGRVKPDLTHFYDQVLTTANNSGYIAVFGGTSAATPITCGNFGLFFQMWHEGVFNGGTMIGASVFDGRPHAATAKAMLINTAEQYFFFGTEHDKDRMHQGWGMPSAGKLYALGKGNRFLRIMDEDPNELLTVGTWREYPVTVQAGTPALKATMVYTDPAAQASANVHRINDLTLRLVSPSNDVFWGNHGLMTGNWSTFTPSGQPDDNDMRNTVENVFVQSPEAGTWFVRVIADEIHQDGHVETPALDADFALVVSVDFDCNGNALFDSEDISLGNSQDCNRNGIPDECQPVRFVDAGLGTPGGGSTWASAFNNLQTAIDAAECGDRIMVKAGDYGPVTLKDGVAVYGGFAGVVSETSPSQANYRVNVTNIVGNGSSPHVVSSINNGPGTILRGVYVKNGNANGLGNSAHGGGLYLENSNAKFVQCVFTNNDAVGNGAAVANMKNAVGAAGNPTFVNCTFHRNKDVGIPTGDILKGGAVYSEAGNPQFVNCLFHKNEAANGGAVYVEDGQAKFFNCTISDNVATSNGGGVYDKLGQSTVRNGILFFNTATSGSQIRNDSGATVATYSDVQGTWTGEGNISGLPRFIDRFADDYTLNVSATPCDDVGRSVDVPADAGDIDWDGNITEQVPKDLAAPATSGGVAVDRRFGGNCTVDMGALEIQGSCSIP